MFILACTVLREKEKHIATKQNLLTFCKSSIFNLPKKCKSCPNFNNNSKSLERTFYSFWSNKSTLENEHNIHTHFDAFEDVHITPLIQCCLLLWELRELMLRSAMNQILNSVFVSSGIKERPRLLNDANCRQMYARRLKWLWFLRNFSILF